VPAVAAAVAAGHEGVTSSTDAEGNPTRSRWCSMELKEARAALEARAARRTWRELGSEMDAARADDLVATNPTPKPNDLVARHNAMATSPDPYPSPALTLSRTRTPNQVARHNAMAKAAVRDQLLGVDRAGRSYWLLTLDPARLWVQEAPPAPPPADVTAMGVRELKAEIASLGGQTAGLLEKI